MKIDIVNTIYIFLLISFFAVAMSYIKTSISEIKNCIFKDIVTKVNNNKIIEFLKKLVVKDFMAYEKYDIWRFCVESDLVKIVI